MQLQICFSLSLTSFSAYSLEKVKTKRHSFRVRFYVRWYDIHMYIRANNRLWFLLANETDTNRVDSIYVCFMR